MYLRTSRRRFVRRTTSRSASQWFWLDAPNNGNVDPIVVVPGTGQQFALDNALNTDYSARKTGAVIHRIVGDVFVVPTAAPGATTDGLLAMSILHRASDSIVTDNSPWSTTGRQLRPLHLEHWQQSYLAAAPANQYQEVARRSIDIRVKRKYRDEQTTLFIIFDDLHAAGTQSWHVYYHLRTLVRVP